MLAPGAPLCEHRRRNALIQLPLSYFTNPHSFERPSRAGVAIHRTGLATIDYTAPKLVTE
jgi:hypothetical protein